LAGEDIDPTAEPDPVAGGEATAPDTTTGGGAGGAAAPEVPPA